MAIRVRAKATGYYNHLRRYAGDMFTVGDEAELGRWMERVPADTPESTTTGPQQLRRECDDRRGRPIGVPLNHMGPLEHGRALVDEGEDEWATY